MVRNTHVSLYAVFESEARTGVYLLEDAPSVNYVAWSFSFLLPVPF